MARPSTVSRLGSSILAAALVASTVLAQSAPSRIAPAGERLAKTLDGMGVETLWLPGRAVHWKTGTVDRDGRQRATHCSAFAAAACDRFGVYLLRPPEHSPTFLATAQAKWLRSRAGEKKGWRKVDGPVAAQRLANEGKIVLAAFANPNPKKPGHIAVVRPSAKSDADVEKDGPQIIQAGAENLRDAPLKRGFSRHQDAIRNRLIEFYANDPAPLAP